MVSLPRIALLGGGLAFLGFGAYFLVQPGQVVRLLGLPTPPPILRAELAAVYGGLEVGVGVFLLLAAARGRWVVPGLGAQICVFGGLLLGRLAGRFMAGDGGPWFLPLLLLEAAGLALGIAGLRRARTLMQSNASRTYW
jgi:hypothetical protein